MQSLLLAVALVGLGVASDTRAPAGRVTEGAAAVRAVAPTTPPFALFGWVSPPVESTTAARYAELAGAGLNLVVPALDDSGRRDDNLARLDAAAAVGARCLLWDRRFMRVDTTVAGLATLDSIVADYKNHPGFFGYYLGDEPMPGIWPRLAQVFAALRVRDPAHPAWNNLLGRGSFGTRDSWMQYLSLYLTTMQPAVLCDDHYDFLTTGDRGQFVENAAGLNAAARARGIPFWAIVLLVEHGPYRAIVEGELRWQVSMLLAYGARGIGYFTYWTPAPDPQWNWQPAVIAQDGTRTSWYDVLAQLNPHVVEAGTALAGLTWLATSHAGSVPAGGAAFAPDDWVSDVRGRAALGHFVAADGTRYLLVANADSLHSQTVGLTLPNARAVAEIATDNPIIVGGGARGTGIAAAGSPAAGFLAVTLVLDAGGFALLRIEGAASGAANAGPGPALALAPNPSGAMVRLALADVASRGQIEILDGAGRRVWARAVAPGGSSLEWRGERDAGGLAPPGIYFVRAADARGVAVRRLAWLGGR